METYVILGVFWELDEELRDQSVVVLGGLRVVGLVVTVLWLVRVGKSDTARLLNEDQVGNLVP